MAAAKDTRTTKPPICFNVTVLPLTLHLKPIELNRRYKFCLRMILSENRFPLFGIMRYHANVTPAREPTPP